MKILIAIKRVIDHTVKIRVKPDGSGIDTQMVKMVVNPFDEIAVEEGIRLKEKAIAREVVVLSIGDNSATESLRHCLALGADRAIHVATSSPTDSLDVAHILANFVRRESPQLILLGKQAIDDDCNQVGQMLAGLLEWPQATFVSELNVENGLLCVAREVDGGIETLRLPFPAVVTTDLRLNQPRYATLPNVMKAKQKPLETFQLGEIGYTLRNKHSLQKVIEPRQRQRGIQVGSVTELLTHLKTAKVLP